MKSGDQVKLIRKDPGFPSKCKAIAPARGFVTFYGGLVTFSKNLQGEILVLHLYANHE